MESKLNNYGLYELSKVSKSEVLFYVNLIQILTVV